MNVRKLTLLLIGCLVTSITFGQSKVVNLAPERIAFMEYKPSESAQARFMELDTIVSPITGDTCSETLFIFPIEQGGTVGGVNGFMDLEKAQRMIYATGNFSVTNIFAFFGAVDIMGDGNLSAKIYEVDETTNGPGVLVATSDPVKVSEINLDPEFVVPTPFVFSTPAQVVGNEFFVSIDLSELYDSQDTVSLFMTDVDCGFAEDAWELFSDGTTWVSISNPDLSWNIVSNFFVIATLELDGVSGTTELIGTNGTIRLHDAFPNPASSSLTIGYDLDLKSSVQIEIYSMDGKLLQQQNQGSQVSGAYQVALSTEQLPEGVYLYGIVTNQGRLMNKFTVTR